MSTLIQDVLALSRVTTRANPLVAVDLNTIVSGVLSDLEVLVEKVQGKVEVSTLPTIEADSTQMRQLFQNLIGNALKFRKKDVPPCSASRPNKSDKRRRSTTTTERRFSGGSKCRTTELALTRSIAKRFLKYSTASTAARNTRVQALASPFAVRSSAGTMARSPATVFSARALRF